MRQPLLRALLLLLLHTSSITSSVEDLLGSTIADVVAEQEALLEYTGGEEGGAAPEGEAPEEERSCSRAGLLRALKKVEERYLKPWELCTGCGGDLLLMMDIKCYEPDDIAPTQTLAQIAPESIRELLERPGITEKVAERERWGEQPAGVCLVGCKSGYRTANSVGTAYLVYECQNITLDYESGVADESKGELPLYSPSWLPPRPGPGDFSADEQKLLAELVNPSRRSRRSHRKQQDDADIPKKGRRARRLALKARAEREAKEREEERSSALAISDEGGKRSLQLWRCISPGQDLKNVNLLHGGMPCAEERLAGCHKPMFDMGFHRDAPAENYLEASTAVAQSPLGLSSNYLACNKLSANPWAVFGEPVASICHERCILPLLERDGMSKAAMGEAAASVAWEAAMAAREEEAQGVGAECAVPDLVSCGNERVRTGALDWTWTGSTDEACDGDTWQLYRPMTEQEELVQGTSEPLLGYKPTSCAMLDPVSRTIIAWNLFGRRSLESSSPMESKQ